MFNIQPGQGLGFTGSKEIAFGLGIPFVVIEAIVAEIIRLDSFIRRTINLISEL